MSSSAEGPRRFLRGLGVAAIIAFTAVGGFFLLPKGLRASLGEISYYLALGIALLLAALVWGFLSLHPLVGWSPRQPDAQSRRRGTLLDGWPKDERRDGDAGDPRKGDART